MERAEWNPNLLILRTIRTRSWSTVSRVCKISCIRMSLSLGFLGGLGKFWGRRLGGGGFMTAPGCASRTAFRQMGTVGVGCLRRGVGLSAPSGSSVPSSAPGSVSLHASELAFLGSRGVLPAPAEGSSPASLPSCGFGSGSGPALPASQNGGGSPSTPAEGALPVAPCAGEALDAADLEDASVGTRPPLCWEVCLLGRAATGSSSSSTSSDQREPRGKEKDAMPSATAADGSGWRTSPSSSACRLDPGSSLCATS
mmetsp:Transcript_17361/g.54503  ORF Transcript_17361/g.54503 Transcript_17361/m.54503 type:complete len:255 (-) Transcript_17361:119-883(-)